MPLFSQPLALHNIDDTEAFAARIIERRRLEWLQPHERTDLLVYLVETCWELSLRYEPNGYAFSQWARQTLELRTVDWLRKEFGRSRWQFAGHTYERERPSLVPLDALDDAGLADALPAGTGDPADDRNPDLERLLDGGDRQAALDHELLGLRPPRRAA